MDSRMNFEVAEQRIADMRRAADATRRAKQVADEPKKPLVIALRAAGPDEEAELRRLAALDSGPPLRGDSLVALVDGKLVAAISLGDGRMISDPLTQTADVSALLRQRASQVDETPRPRRRFRLRPV